MRYYQRGYEANSISPAQEEVFATGLLHTGFNCVLQMPTGSGKTWLAEQAIAAVLAKGLRAIYLTPLRSLATELVNKWQRHFGSYLIGAFTGDYGGSGKPYPMSFEDARVLIMTPERLDLCTRFWRVHWSWIPQVDLIVVDELHLLGDRERGARLEGTLWRVRRLNPFARIIGLSATLGNPHELAEWLDGVGYKSDWRPVPIEWRVVRYHRAEEKPAVLLREVARTTEGGGKSIVFVQSRRRAEQLSCVLAGHGLKVSHHHAGLTYADRKRVETEFRGMKIDVVVATSTLEMGVNLPARQVIIYDLQSFDGNEFKPLSTNSIWQRVGRAGRPGLDPNGEAVLIAPVWDRDVERYRKGLFEPIKSGLSDARAVAEQIVAEVGSGLARTEEQITALFRQSLAHRQGTLPDVTKIIGAMKNAEMIRDVPQADGSKINAAPKLETTRFGRVAVRHLISPSTISFFRSILETHSQLTFLDLLITASSVSDCDPILPADFEELEQLSSDLSNERSVLLGLPRAELAQIVGIDGKRLLGTLKTAVVARAWTRLGEITLVAEKYGCYPSEVAQLRRSLERIFTVLAALTEKSTAPLEPEEISVNEKTNILLKMISDGLDECAVTLTLIPRVGAKLARRLCSGGIQDIEELALSDSANISSKTPGVSTKRAERWINEARELISRVSAWRYREFGASNRLELTNWPNEIDPYRLRRAMDLKVTRLKAKLYRVTGGLDPHLVRILRSELWCDCPDHKAGNTCKHILAVKIARRDANIRDLCLKLSRSETRSSVDLFQLWTAQTRTVKGDKQLWKTQPGHSTHAVA